MKEHSGRQLAEAAAHQPSLQDIGGALWPARLWPCVGGGICRVAQLGSWFILAGLGCHLKHLLAQGSCWSVGFSGDACSVSCADSGQQLVQRPGRS